MKIGSQITIPNFIFPYISLIYGVFPYAVRHFYAILHSGNAEQATESRCYFIFFKLTDRPFQRVISNMNIGVHRGFNACVSQ